MSLQRADPGEDHFDLLPFIAILMCILGCLLLVTITVAALSMGVAAGEGWIPAKTSGSDAKRPFLIEWDGSTAAFHRDGKVVRATWGEQTVGGNAEFEKLLGEVEQMRETHYALFAVRPSGFKTFNFFAGQFRKREIKVGYEPIQSGKPVRLLNGPSAP